MILFSAIGIASAADIIIGEGTGNTTINAALANATDGDTIIVSDGTYTENIVVNKSVIIRSENGSASTVVNAASIDTHIFNVTASNVTISGFNVTGATNYSSIYVFSALNCNISDNLVSESYAGIYFYNSNDSTISNNQIGSNTIGIYLQKSANNTMVNNTMESNDYNFGTYGPNPEHFVHNIDTSNQVNGKPLYYLVDQADTQVPLDAGQVYVVSSANITVKDISISNGYEGVMLAYTNNSRVENITVSQNAGGVLLVNSDSNTLDKINAINNTYGIYLENSTDNTLTDSIIGSSGWDGISLYSSSNHNVLDNNTIDSGGCDGIYIDNSENNILSNNTIIDNPESGIDLYYSDSNSMVGNIVINNTYHGIHLNVSSYNTLTGNNASDNLKSGIYLYNVSNYNVLDDNTAINNTEKGIFLLNASNSILTNSSVSSNDYGIFLEDSTNNTLANNTMASNDFNFGVYGPELEHFVHDIDTSNMVNGKPLYYLITQADMQVPLDAGQVYVINSTNVTVRDISVSNGYHGIAFAYTSNSRIENFTASDCYRGIYMMHSDFNTIESIVTNDNIYGLEIKMSGNNLLSNSTSISNIAGLYLINSSNNDLNNIDLDSNTINGIRFSNSDNNNLTNSTANDSFIGIDISNSAFNTINNNTANTGNYYGIYIYRSDNNTLTNNTASSNEQAGIYFYYADSNTLENNTANDNDLDGIALRYSSNNVFINNTANTNSRAGFVLEGSNSNTLTDNSARGSTGDWASITANMGIESLSNEPLTTYFDEMGSIVNTEEYALFDLASSPEYQGQSASMDSRLNPTASVVSTSFGVAVGFSSDNVISSTRTTGNYYGLYTLLSANNTISDLILTNGLAQLSFVTDESMILMSGSDSNSVQFSGKANVNGYVGIVHSSVAPSSALPSPDNMLIAYSYDDSGMSNATETSVSLFRINNARWAQVPNATLNTTGNYVFANLTEFGTFGLFKDAAGSAVPTFSGSHDDSLAARIRSQGTVTDLPVTGDGEITADTVIRSSDASTTLSMSKGTKALDSYGNPVNKIIVTTPASLPANTPGEVIESGLYFDFGPSGTTFNQDVLVTMDFDPEEFEGRTPVIYTYTSEDGWIALETTIDWENGRATAMIRHFSLYALFGSDSESTQEISLEPASEITETSATAEEETSVEEKSGFGYLYWIIGIAVVLALGILTVKKK
ncbi:MAG: NosD domain-containing protein [Methanolobus sp.]|nr:NosD domain-containing protein [Methanolobus sp.]